MKEVGIGTYLVKPVINERRERIATAALNGMLADGCKLKESDVALCCVIYADALIAELDKVK